MVVGCQPRLPRSLSGAAIFDVDTNTVAFTPQALGAIDQQVVVVSNGQTDPDGDSLVITSTSVVGIPSSPGLDWCGAGGCPVIQVQYCVVDGEPVSGGQCGIENFEESQPVELPPGGEVDVLLTYYAETPSSVQGEVHFETNAARTNVGPGLGYPGRGVVQIVTRALAGRLDINPDPINFGRVASDGTEGERCVDTLFRNIGTNELTLTNWSVLGGGGAFRVREDSVFGTVAPPSTNTVVLNPNDEIQVTLCFAPATDEPASANLLVELGEEREFVDLVGNGSEPCIEVNHERGYDFGAVSMGDAAPAEFEITNCAALWRGETLLVDPTALVALEGRDAELVAYAMPNPPGELALEPGESASFVVTCTPQDFVPYAGRLRINSNDALKPQLDIGLTCLGVALPPPVADVGCRLLGSIGPYARELRVRAGDGIECSAAGSSDEDGNIVAWRWLSQSAPLDATPTFAMPEAEVTSATLDVAGTYVVVAEVVDDSGLLNAVVCDSDSDRVPDLRGCEALRREELRVLCDDGEGGFDPSDCQARRGDRVVVVAR